MDIQNFENRTIESQIDWVLAHPGMSSWLKTTLSSGRERHPIEVLNDLEILNHVLRARCEAFLCRGPERR